MGQFEWLNNLEKNSTDDAESERFNKWAEISEDMIKSGVESCVFQYYDAKQSMYPHLLPPRPHQKPHFVIDDIALELEGRIKVTTDEDQLELLNNIYITFCELFATGMKEIAITYYLRKKNGYPNLDLPELN